MAGAVADYIEDSKKYASDTLKSAADTVKDTASKISDTIGEYTPDIYIPGFGVYRFNPKEDYKQAVKRWTEVTGQTEEKFNEYFTKAVQAGEETVEKAKELPSKAADKMGEVTPDIYIPGFGKYTFNPKEDTQQAKKRFQEVTGQGEEVFHKLWEWFRWGIKHPGQAMSEAMGSAKEAASRASDKMGEMTPDINIPGFGPYRFNPKEDAKQAQKRFQEVTGKGQEEFNKAWEQFTWAAQHPGEAASRASDKMGEMTPDINIPGFGPYKFNPKEDAKQAQKRFQEVTGKGQEEFNKAWEQFSWAAQHPGEAASRASDKMGEMTPDINIPGFGPYKFNPKEDYQQAKKRFQELTGLGEDAFNKAYEQFKEAAQHPVEAASRASDKMGEMTPDINIPGFGPYRFNPKEDAKQAQKRFQEVTGKGQEEFNKAYEQFKEAAQHPVEAASRASDKMGEMTPDINVPGFGPYKFKPKEDAKQAQKRFQEMTGQGQEAFNKAYEQFTEAAQHPVEAASRASDKMGEMTPDINVPGFGPYKFNPKEDAKQAQKRFQEATGQDQEAFNKAWEQFSWAAQHPGEAASKASDKMGEMTPDISVPGFGPYKFNPKEDYQQAKKRFQELTGLGEDAFNKAWEQFKQAVQHPGEAASRASDKMGEMTPDINVPGFGPYKFNPREDAKQAQKRFQEVTGKGQEEFNKAYEQFKDAAQHPGEAASRASDKMGEMTPDINVPGFGAYKFNPKEDAKQAQKRFQEATGKGQEEFNKAYEQFKDAAQHPGEAASRASDKMGEMTPDINVPGFGPYKFNPKEDYQQAKKRFQELTGMGEDAFNKAWEQFKQATQQAGESAGRGADRATEAAGRGADRASDAAHKGIDRVSDTAHKGVDKVSEGAGESRTRVEAAGELHKDVGKLSLDDPVEKIRGSA
jgi:pimeloyl-CoA synthetase